MNRVSMMLACAAMLFAVQPALASDDVAAELAEMRELMQGLQEKVEAQEEQLVHQGELLEKAQDVVRTQQGEGTSSGLDDFLDAISVGGHVAGSYNYNLSTPKRSTGGTGLNSGMSGSFLPFHQDHNTFTVDQIWFSIAKEATEESRAGFGFDIFYGQNANFLGQGTTTTTVTFDDAVHTDPVTIMVPTSRRSNNDGTSDYYVHQAYIEYQCDCLGPEVNWKFGKWQTLVGAEVAQATGNYNITRGNVYTLLQPVDHMGLLASVPVGDNAEISAAIMNDGFSSISSPDNNKEKSYMVSALVGDDKANVRASYIYGATMTGNNHDRTGLVDVTAFFNPSDNLSTWVNYNYVYLEDSSQYVHGVAVAGRLQVTDKVGAALRGEYVNDHVSGRFGDFLSVFAPTQRKEIWSLTGTLDYAATDHLTLRSEARVDFVHRRRLTEGFPNFAPPEQEAFFENSTGSADNQTVLLVEAVYEF